MTASRTIAVEILGDASSIERAFRTTSTAGTKLQGDLASLARATVTTQTQSREALTKLAAEYQAVAASAKKGSDEQIAAAKLAADAQAKLAKQTQISADEQMKALDQAAAAATRVEGTAKKIGSSMGLWLAAPAAAAGIASAIKATQKFSADMELLHTQAGASTQEVTKMTAAVKQLGPAVGTGPDELSAGLYHVESAGLRGSKALDALTAAAKGARLGNADLEDVTNALNAVLVSGIKGSADYEKAMGSLNATVGAGDMRMQDLADAMGSGLPAKAKLMGLSLNDVDAALAVFGDNNIRGADAGTLLGSAIRLLGAPSKVAAKELSGLGLSSTQLADDMRSGGISKAIGDLKDRMDAMGLSASEQSVVLTRAFGGKQAGGIMILIDQLDRLKQKEGDVGSGAENFGRDWAKYTEQSQFQTQKFQAALEVLRIEVGNALMPEFTAATKELSAWLDRMEKSGAIQRDTEKAAHDLAVAVHAVQDAIRAVDGVTGGFTQTLEVLLGMKVASTLGLWSGSFVKLGASAGVAGAQGEVVGLMGALQNLAALGIVTVTVDVLENLIPSSVTKGGQSALNSAGAGWLGNLPLVGGAAQAGAYTAQKLFGQTKPTAQGAAEMAGAAKGPMTPAEMAAYKAGLAGKSISLTGISGSVLQAYEQGRAAGNHPIGGAAGSAAGGTSPYVQMAAAAAAQYGVPQGMFLAQIKQESGFDPNAKSKAGAEGIAQFMPGTAKGYGINPLDPKQALPAAAKMMAGLYNKYGDWGLALAAYNAGAGTVDKYLAGKGSLPAETTAYVKSITGSPLTSTFGSRAGQPTQAQLDALGLGASGGSPKKAKKPPIISGANEIPADLQKAIAKYGTLEKTSRGSAALVYVQSEEANLEDARAALQKLVKGQSGKQAAATEKEIAALTKKIQTPAIVSGSDLLPQSLLDAISKAKSAATSSTGAAAEKYLDTEKGLLLKARDDLQGELAGATGKQAAAIHAEIDEINSQIATVNKSIASNLKAQATAIKSNAKTAISQAQSNIASAFSNIIDDAKTAFETETQNYIDTVLAAQYDQGTDPVTGLQRQTPLEQQLSDMQAADTKQGLQDSIDQAKKQLALDQQTAGVTQDQLDADQKAIDQAQRAYDENDLSIQATAERARTDAAYAAAVQQYQADRSVEEHAMVVSLQQLEKGIENGTQTIDGKGGLNDILAGFGVSIQDLPTDQFSTDLDTLSKATQDLAQVFIDEAQALAKIGDSKDAASAAASAAALTSDPAWQAAVAAANAAPLDESDVISRLLGRSGIPQLASGGVAVRPTVAIIGEAGPEAVIPLDRLSTAGGGGVSEVHVHLHGGTFIGVPKTSVGRELAKVVQPHLSRIVSVNKR